MIGIAGHAPGVTVAAHTHDGPNIATSTSAAPKIIAVCRWMAR
jgi:hypothetical protein